MGRTGDAGWPRPDRGPLPVAGWFVGYALLYLLLLAVGWLAPMVLTEGTRLSLGEFVLVLWVVVCFGCSFWLPSLLLLVVVGMVGLLAPGSAFRATALIGFPLIAVMIPVEGPPSTGYGAQLLFVVPLHAAFALLLRRPAAEHDEADDELLAAWGLTYSGDQPGPEPVARPDRPSRWWYATLLGVLAWLALLLTGGRPLLVQLTPLGVAPGPVDIAIVSLPVLGIGYVAGTRWCGRRCRDGRRCTLRPAAAG